MQLSVKLTEIEYRGRYTFSAKEKDTETGYSYFGARYYYSVPIAIGIRVWLSVDPLADKNYGISPYNYCHWNPIVIIDPDGMDDYFISYSGNIDKKVTDSKSHNYYYIDKDGKKTTLGSFKKEGDKMVNLEGKSTSDFKNLAKSEKQFLNSDAMAGFLGAAHEYKKETGDAVEVTQFSYNNGGHSDHNKGGDGMFIDVRYARNDDGTGPVNVTSKNFDLAQSQTLADKFSKFGYNNTPSTIRIITENAAGNGAALKNTFFSKPKNGQKYEHKSHMHLQHFDTKNKIRIL